VLTALAVAVVAVLLVFTIRRIVLLGAALPPPRPSGDATPALSVLLVVAARNERAGIDATLASLDRLAYSRLSIVLVNDASDDDTGARLAAFAATRPDVRTIDLATNVGKPRAIAAGVAAASPADLIAVFDADVRPRPDYLRRVAAAFADETVGGAVGFLAPRNGGASAIARYAALESWVHQLVTSAGKNRLDLNPPTLGGAAVYRRAALERIGGLGGGPSGDDVRATVALTRDGWRTRFVGDAVADVEVVERWSHYRRQHVRWARDLFATASHEDAATAAVPVRRRVELALLSAGYVDRVAFLLAIVLVMAGVLSPLVPIVYLAVAAAGIVVAVAKAGAARELPAFAIAASAVFALDVVSTVIATVAHLLRVPRVTQTPERQGAVD
jgi:cellulose synthase/poly-beta-1,6-N-acetylglucosamine synthase-like glycosyltransferase